MHGLCEAIKLDFCLRRSRSADQNGEEDDAGRNQDEAADGGDDDPQACRLQRGIGKVEIGHAPRHAEDADPMPWEGGDHHADEPEPELRPHQAKLGERPAGEMWPEIVGDGEIHDDDGAAEDQVEMAGNPLGVMD